MIDRKDVVVVGAGLAGSLLSILLRRRGYDVRLFERRGDSRIGAEYGGRSINLALSYRGLRALRRAGLADKALDLAIPMRGRQIHSKDRSGVLQPYSTRPDQYINSISRSGLNELLLDTAESEGVDILFEHTCFDVDFRARNLTFQDTRTGNRTIITPAATFAADGAGSAVRQAMEVAGLTESRSDFLDHGYKELTIPASPDGGFRLDPVEALHIWPRRSFMLIALPNLDRSFTCTLFLALEGETSFDSLQTDRDIVRFFEAEFPDALDHMPDLLTDFRENPVSPLGTLRCYPWRVDDFCLLVGDAAHAIVPFYGQGMNCAFEDCLILDELMELGMDRWDALFGTYETGRKQDADAIADLALENFVEMRDKVADERFALRKKLELELARRFPERYVPIYSHVTFSAIPYHRALQAAKTQAAALDAFLMPYESVNEVDWARAKILVESLREERTAGGETTA